MKSPSPGLLVAYNLNAEFSASCCNTTGMLPTYASTNIPPANTCSFLLREKLDAVWVYGDFVSI